ncbi:MAG: hypothetical protein HQL25_01720 [Candidatus Omnitrophica bacterium]|nr:hypothetical protein [Candidatus Omnitrophota bacterium]
MVVAQIQEIVKKSNSRSASKNGEDHLIEMYWQIGRCIYQHVLDRKKTSYGKYFSIKLAKDVKLARPELIRALQFFREYHVKDAKSKLTWTHYKILLTIKDLTLRKELEQQAITEHWTSRQLIAKTANYKNSLKQNKVQKKELIPTSSDNNNNPAELKLGWLYTYQILRDRHSSSKFWIDLGFDMRLRVPENISVQDGDITSASWDNGKIQLQGMLGLEKELLYTYGATIEKILDTGALAIEIDCGFGILLRKKIFLAGTMPILSDPKKGSRAMNFLNRKLSTGQKIVLKMLWGDGTQPEAIVFYHPDAKKYTDIVKEGLCINEAIIDRSARKIFV